MGHWKNETGKAIRLLTCLDLTDADVMRILYWKPDDTQGYWNGIMDGVKNNKILYETVAGDLDQAGLWHLQTYVESDGRTYKGDYVKIKVQIGIKTT